MSLELHYEKDVLLTSSLGWRKCGLPNVRTSVLVGMEKLPSLLVFRSDIEW